ncbi:MAG: FadR/GntR family transcriptional regulator [Pseudohongiellaceae bacterium]
MTHNITISHEISESLRSDILGNRYLSGDRLPSERDLATRFRSSRGAVREGLSQLEQIGLIRIMPGGARVQPIENASLGVLGPLLEFGETPDPKLVDQFLEAFGALASVTARSAVEKASQEELNQLQQLVVNLAKQNNISDKAQQQWRGLFEAMAEIADNLVIRLISNDLRAQFLDHMTSLGINLDQRERLAASTLKNLKYSLKQADAELTGKAIFDHFADLRIAVSNRISDLETEAQA